MESLTGVDPVSPANVLLPEAEISRTVSDSTLTHAVTTQPLDPGSAIQWPTSSSMSVFQQALGQPVQFVVDKEGERSSSSSDSSSSDSSSYSSSDSSSESLGLGRRCGDVDDEKLPAVFTKHIMEEGPPIQFVPDPDAKITLVGKVASKVQDTIVVMHTNTELKTLDVDSILCLEDRRVLGRIYEALGPVFAPFYTVPLPKAPTFAENATTKKKNQRKNAQGKASTEAQQTLATTTEQAGTNSETNGATASTTEAAKIEAHPGEAMKETVPEQQVKLEGDERKTVGVIEEGEIELTGNEKHQETEEEKKKREAIEEHQRVLHERKQVFADANPGDLVYVLEGHYHVVDPRLIYTPGCDASAKDDQEVPEWEQEYSDDEAELRSKKKRKGLDIVDDEDPYSEEYEGPPQKKQCGRGRQDRGFGRGQQSGGRGQHYGQGRGQGQGQGQGRGRGGRGRGRDSHINADDNFNRNNNGPMSQHQGPYPMMQMPLGYVPQQPQQPNQQQPQSMQQLQMLSQLMMPAQQQQQQQQTMQQIHQLHQILQQQPPAQQQMFMQQQQQHMQQQQVQHLQQQQQMQMMMGQLAQQGLVQPQKQAQQNFQQWGAMQLGAQQGQGQGQGQQFSAQQGNQQSFLSQAGQPGMPQQFTPQPQPGMPQPLFIPEYNGVGQQPQTQIQPKQQFQQLLQLQQHGQQYGQQQGQPQNQQGYF